MLNYVITVCIFLLLICLVDLELVMMRGVYLFVQCRQYQMDGNKWQYLFLTEGKEEERKGRF